MAEPGKDGAGGERFLARWSRLKRAARGEAQAAEAAPAPAEASPAPAPAEGIGEAPIDLELLPKLEEITAETDLGPFLRKGVPAALRNAALRRAWSLDPTIRDFIGPADYAWDWNTPGGVPDFLDGVGETPAIRALVERMLSPPREAEARGEADASDRDGRASAAPASDLAAPGVPAAPRDDHGQVAG
ncbi:MAG: DUF3306 domain-containing protein, partial [Acetobacteraceae bacterium]